MAQLTPHEGLVLDRYVLTRRLGPSGAREIWEARDPQTQGVVVEIVATEPSESAVRIRFRDAAIRFPKLDAPHVNPVLGAGEEGGLLWLARPFLSGGRLSERLSEPFPLPVTLDWLRSLAAALDSVHAKGVVHRDVHPGNVQFDENGRIFLSGFLSALLGAAGVPLPAVALEFRAPEVFRGEQPEPASDQYSLGVLAFRLMTGRLPVDGVASGIEAAGLPAPVATVFERVLASKPSSRFASVSTFHEALVTAVGGSMTFEGRPQAPAGEPVVDPLETTMSRKKKAAVLPPPPPPKSRVPHFLALLAIVAVAALVLARRAQIPEPPPIEPTPDPATASTASTQSTASTDAPPSTLTPEPAQTPRAERPPSPTPTPEILGKIPTPTPSGLPDAKSVAISSAEWRIVGDDYVLKVTFAKPIAAPKVNLARLGLRIFVTSRGDVPLVRGHDYKARFEAESSALLLSIPKAGTDFARIYKPLEPGDTLRVEIAGAASNPFPQDVIEARVQP